jgi:DNA-binding NtrC family response regulator
MASVHTPNILIVEDDDALRGELVELLKALGALAIGVADGAQAIHACHLQPFDLVLCDYKLRAENGLDVLKALGDVATPPAADHCYLMTAHVDLTAAAQQDIESSTAGLLHKPIAAAMLRRIVADAAEARRC